MFSSDVDPETGEPVIICDPEIGAVYYPRPSSSSEGRPRS